MALLTALLAATLPLTSDGRAQLLPAGEFAARDGRPGPGKSWRIDDARGLTIAAQLNAIASVTPVVIDYEHQTFKAAENGKPAPAAGWIKSVSWLTGKGLMAEVEWAPSAKASIQAGEYRYISPVITHDETTGDVTGVLMAALTNFPALLGMDAVVASLCAFTGRTADPQETHDMALLTALLTALGLGATLTETEALAAVTALKATADAAKAKPPVPTALVTELGLQAGADEVAALSAIKALRTPADATVQLVTTLQGQVTTLTAQINAEKVDKAIDAAIKANKITEAQRAAYQDVGRKDFAMLSALLDAAVVIPGLNGQTGGKSPAGDAAGADGVAALTAAQRSVCTMLGLDPATYAKQLKAASAAT